MFYFSVCFPLPAEQQPAQPISCETIDMEQSVITTEPYTKGMTCIDTSKSAMVYEKELSRSLEQQQFSGQVTVSGILQAYWRPIDNMQTGKLMKVLAFLFYPDYAPENQGKFPKFQLNNKPLVIPMIRLFPLTGPNFSINDEPSELLTTKKSLAQIKAEFNADMTKFLKYREGIAAQRVLLTLDNFRAYADCGAYVYYVRALRGKGSTGWFYDFKLHLIINDEGEIMALKVIAENVDDRVPVPEMCKDLWGTVYGDKGYISGKLEEQLAKTSVKQVTNVRKGMKAKILTVG